MTRRQVRVTEQFFDRLDELFPESRSPEGAPSGTDFLLHEMPNVIEAVAVDFEGSTMSTRSDPDVRVLIAAGLLVPFFSVYASIVGEDAVEIFYLDID